MSTPPGVLLRQRLDALRPHTPYNMEKFVIYQLPDFLNHDRNKVLFEPSAVAIGPYYHSRENCHVMEEYKLHYLRDFLARNPKVDLEGCIQEIPFIKNEVHECYNEVVHLNSDEFVDMLLLNGCFILELSLKYKERAHDIVCRPGFLFDPIRIDLLLFQNQIPFFVLEKLFFLVQRRDDSYNDLVNILTKLLLGSGMLGPPQILRGKIHHLLHLYHELFVPRIASHRRKCSSCTGALEEGKYHKKHVISCATQLCEAGVKFHYKKSYKNKFDIKYKDGIIEMPALKIDTNFKRLYPNLLAFEVCLCHENRTMSSYIVLLDLPINTKEDVDLLQRNGVIENTLPNNEELADYLNLIGKITYIDYCDHYFSGLFHDICSYYHLEWNKHRARFVHDYCNTPWTFISVLAASIILILTGVQAFFAFYPYMKMK